MEFQEFVNSVGMACCVISVKKEEDGSCGEIRIVKANEAYIQAMGPKYYDNMPYYELVPREPKFEDFCYRAAILKKKMHAYVEVREMNCWIDQTLIPLASDSEETGYCQFIFEATFDAEANRMSSLPADIAEQIIRASIKLIGSDDIKESVGAVLADIMAFSESDGVRIMLTDDEKQEAVIFGECLNEEAWPNKKDEENDVITYDLIKTWENALGTSNCVIVKDEDDMALLEKKNKTWVDSMRDSGVTSLVLMPLWNKKKVVGYLYVCNFNTEKVVKVKELIELMSFFLGTIISNHMLMDQLEMLSEIDVLTGIQNRRAMIRHSENMEKSTDRRPFGVVNIDINGLKIVNDNAGHDEGDKLLTRTAEILRMVFRKDDLFRTGGDEFIVFASDIAEELFNEKVKRLREIMENDSLVSFAIGDYWSDGTVKAQDALRFADEKMYEDKKAFYENHTEFKR